MPTKAFRKVHLTLRCKQMRKRLWKYRLTVSVSTTLAPASAEARPRPSHAAGIGWGSSRLVGVAGDGRTLASLPTMKEFRLKCRRVIAERA